MLAEDDAVRFDHSDTPEFDFWSWVSYWYPLGQVVPFKKEVYRRAMKELAPGLSKCLTYTP
jgi:putative (di)nucleoside polyphosphate hydrolase